METIHFKTVDPVSQDLLRGASQQGLDLNWERYEKQQPQDGFLRLGLACPYGCMQGPCRIDPYGRGADRGICGLDRDGMAAALLLRLALQGVLEAMDTYQTGHHGAEIAWPAPLDKKAAASLSTLGGAPLSTQEMLSSAMLLARPSSPPEILVRQAIRLGLLGIGLAEQSRTPDTSINSMGCRAGYGLLAGNAVTIAVAGRLPSSLTLAFAKETANLKKPDVRLVSLGEWIHAGECFLPMVCSSGEAETVLASGKIDLLLAGPQCEQGLLSLCARMNVPILPITKNPDAGTILQQARSAFDSRVPCAFSPDASLIGEGRVAVSSSGVQEILKNAHTGKIALIGGADSLFHSFGHLPVELAKALHGAECTVASWGDAAIWTLKQDLPVRILEAQEGPLHVVRALTSSGKLSDLKGICFTGLRDCREFTFALGLASLGMKVSVANPLPLWGSERVRAALQEGLAAGGGMLTHFDHPVQGDELLDWFLRS
jgi:hypothetical protein